MLRALSYPSFSVSRSRFSPYLSLLRSFLLFPEFLLLLFLPPTLFLTLFLFLICPRCLPLFSLLLNGKPSSATAATVAIAVLVGAKLPQFCTFYTAREKKRIIFGGNATILSAVVMWDQLVSTAAARYTCPLRAVSNPRYAFSNIALIGKEFRDFLGTETWYVDSRHLGDLDVRK